ncbi:MAG: sigma-70 family RNA polymerase sigma factor [Candidatus Zixiibacteriota bacterium]|nr:MAG: sigma-70 family RNA polymerase sigma factor [candidate division Zixibacteria bacterium]
MDWRLLSEAELIEACRERREEAWRELHRRYCRLIYHCILQIFAGAAREDVEDITQGVYLQLLRGQLDRYDASLGAFSTWVGLISTRQTINYLKSREYRQRSSQVVLTADCASYHPAVKLSQRLDLDDALKRLSPDEYRLLAWRYGEELTLETIAAIRGKAVSTISRQIKRILKRVQRDAKS